MCSRKFFIDYIVHFETKMKPEWRKLELILQNLYNMQTLAIIIY